MGGLLAWWKVPYPQNVFFTGRTSILEQLHAIFLAKNAGVFVQAINGLGGSGKTQIALEYVYRYVQSYQAVFWVAADPQGDLLADFVSIAQFLHLPEQFDLAYQAWNEIVFHLHVSTTCVPVFFLTSGLSIEINLSISV